MAEASRSNLSLLCRTTGSLFEGKRNKTSILRTTDALQAGMKLVLSARTQYHLIDVHEEVPLGQSTYRGTSYYPS